MNERKYVALHRKFLTGFAAAFEQTNVSTTENSRPHFHRESSNVALRGSATQVKLGMGRFTRALVLLVGSGFVLLSLISAAIGQNRAAFGALVFGGVVAFIGDIG